MAAEDLSPRLREAVAGLDAVIVPALVKFGATSHVVVANNWDSTDELIDELGLDAPTGDLATVWLRCEDLCARSARTAEIPPTQALVSAKSSPASSSKEPFAAGNSEKSKAGTHKTKMPAFVACSERIDKRKKVHLPDVVVLTADRESEKLQAKAEEIWLEVMQHDGETRREHNLVSLEGRDEFKTLFLEHVCSHSLQYLTQALGGCKRWKKYCAKNDLSPTTTGKTNIAMWLRSTKSGGATAPKNPLVALRKMSSFLGTTLNTDHFLVKGQTMGAKTKTTTPATPLRMELWIRLEKDMKSKTMEGP